MRPSLCIISHYSLLFLTVIILPLLLFFVILLTERRIVEFNNYAQETLVMNFHPSTPCRTIVSHLVWSIDTQCLAVATSSSLASTNNLQRYNSQPAGTKKAVALMYKNPPGGPFRSSGFFTKGGNAKGRRRFREKIGPLIQELELVEGEILDQLTSRGLARGSDITVLVSQFLAIPMSVYIK